MSIKIKEGHENRIKKNSLLIGFAIGNIVFTKRFQRLIRESKLNLHQLLLI